MRLPRGSAVYLLLLTVAALVSEMPAQVAGTAGSDAQGNGAVPAAVGHIPSADENGPAPPSGGFPEWPVFVIPGLASLGDMTGSGIIMGAGLSGGYGWVNTSPQDNPSGALAVAQPYLGVYQSGYRHKVLFEYSPAVDFVNQDKWDGGVLQRGGVRGYSDISKRWQWVFSGYSTYGTEYLRELGGAAVGEYPGYLTFSKPSDTELLATGMTGLNWRRKPRQEFSLMAGGTYNYIRQGPHYNATQARAQMSNYFGHYSKWYTYAQANRYSDQPGCTRVGAGAGLVFNANASTTLTLEGGPEYGSGQCTLRLTSNFNATLAQHITPWTVLYLGATRDLMEPYLLQSRWTDIYSARLWQKTSQSTDFSLGAGYALSSDLPGQTVPYYRGLLLSSQFRWRLSSSFSLVGSYHYFKRDLEVANPGLEVRNSWAFLSLVWHPPSRGGRRS